LGKKYAPVLRHVDALEIGDFVKQDELVATIETDKVVPSLPSQPELTLFGRLTWRLIHPKAA
jgi:hypothetical protein